MTARIHLRGGGSVPRGSRYRWRVACTDRLTGFVKRAVPDTEYESTPVDDRCIACNRLFQQMTSKGRAT